MKIRTWIQAGVAGCLMLLVSGCDDWEFGGSADSWSDRHNLVNFSGVYTGAGGEPILTFSGAAGTAGLDQVTNEILVRLSGDTPVYSGFFSKNKISPGTVTIFGPDGLRWQDNGAGVLTSIGAAIGRNGTINYQTGAWRLEIDTPVPEGHLRAIYSWVYRNVNRFTVTQEGNQLTIVDDNGGVYRGNFGSVRTPTGESLDDVNRTTTLAGPVVASFEVRGMLGRTEITITGQFTSGANMTARRIQGTWIEPHMTGNINGQAQ